MKTVLVCIAKNEDNYIDEWIKYHTKLGFDDIYVYQNNWRYLGNKLQYNNVTWLEFDGEIKQLEAYANFLKNYWEKYNWAAFFDVDEFLSLKNISFSDYLQKMNNVYGIGINWRVFGNNNLSFNNDYSVLSRFTKCEKYHNQHIKTMLNLTKLAPFLYLDKWYFSLFKNNIRFQNPHNILLSNSTNVIVDADNSTYINGPFNKTNKIYDVQLNHYFFKTFEEFQYKIARGRATRIDKASLRTNKDYDNHNYNDIEDLTAKNFYNS